MHLLEERKLLRTQVAGHTEKYTDAPKPNNNNYTLTQKAHRAKFTNKVY